MTEHTSYRWRKRVRWAEARPPVKRLKKIVAEKNFDLSILKEVSGAHNAAAWAGTVG